MTEYIVIAILTILSLLLFSINIKQKNTTIEIIKESQNNFLRKLGTMIELSKKEQEKIYLQERKKIKDKNDKVQEYKINQLIDKMLRELEREGINNVIFDVSSPHTQNGLKKEKFIFVSYDSKEEMYDTLIFDKKNFNNKFDVRMSLNSIQREFKNHWKDKIIIEEVIKNNIKKMLADNLMKELDGNDEEEKNFNNISHTSSRRAKKQLKVPMPTPVSQSTNIPRKPISSGNRIL